MSNFLTEIVDSLKRPVKRARAQSELMRDVKRVLALAETLLSNRGEASGVALARELLAGYGELSEEARQTWFLGLLSAQFNAAPMRVAQAYAAYEKSPNAATARALHQAAEPPRQELLRRLNLAPGGTHALVRMREDLLRSLPTQPSLASVDADFAHLFASWFNRGFLSLRLIDWSTPAHILEKIIHYEAVHAIQSWDDLRARLAPPDRRCFAFFHPALVDEPLIFVEVALCAEMPDAIAPLIDPQRVPLEGSMLTKEATTAVFYSISNCQDGLRGVSFGNFLIKQVVEELKREANALPALKTFVTLSPVPGFVAWLNKERKAKQTALNFVELANLQAIDQPIWPEDPSQVRLLRPLLNRLMTQYLVETKSRNGRPLDAVARFHLGNGARLERLNWLGDRSAKGLAQSAGMMVNYLYDLSDIESNHEAYANQHRVVASRAVTRMLKLNRA